MKINKFNENLEEDDFNGQVKVKDIIKYLSELDPETDVYLDKDGWDANGKNGYEIVKNSYLFYQYRGGLTINN